ncbi:MAG: B12-binding domain-containing radical SAM protein [bacterium]|nr:B12-binding domain-containing radical SAM protein [bacterium]
MKLLFLEIDTESSWAVAALGPASIASFLRQHRHQAAMLRVTLEMSVAELVAGIREARPDLLGLSLTTRQWQRARALVTAVRRELELPVIAGGMHPTYASREVLESPGFDYVCVGEGEEATLELVNALEQERRVAAGSIANIAVRGGPRPQLRPPFAQLDALPPLARDLLDETRGVVHMLTQRGCPFSCTYCAARSYRDLYHGHGGYSRRRSPGHVLEELCALERAGELAFVIFLDDTFTIQRSWVEEFCRLYARQPGVPFSVQARVETVDPELLLELAETGCRHITYGVESGSLRVRRDIMRRPVTNDELVEAFRWTREAGILVTANYMLGLPGESADDIEATLALHEELQPADFGVFVFYPYPGTHLFRVCRQKGYLPEDYRDLPVDHQRSILRLPGLRPETIAHYYDRFTELRERLYRERYGGLPGTGVAGPQPVP